MKRSKSMGWWVLAWIAVAALSGCASPKPPVAELPVAPSTFRQGDPRWVALKPAEAQPRGEWWRVFEDARLDALIGAATSGNTSIQVAVARLARARAIAGMADANRKPQVGLNAGFDRLGGPLVNAAGDSGSLWTLSAGLTYEADLFGRLAREVDAATLDAEARAAMLESAWLLVHADVAQTYFALRSVDRERVLLREVLRTQKDALVLTERRFALGSVAELDVARLRSEYASVETELIVLDRRRAELEHALAMLVGEVASTFRVEEQPWDPALPMIPAGIPSTVLSRRADVASAQRGVLAAQARLGAAQSAWFPSVSLTTAQGFASTALRDLVGVSVRAWGIGALLSLPLFDGGKRDAALQAASADWDAAMAGYREQILLAFKDVEDQLVGLRTLGDQASVQSAAVTAAERVRFLAASRYNSGLGSQLEVLDAQRSELRVRRQALQVRASQFQTTVGLVRALGGGWGESPATVSRRMSDDQHASLH